MAGEAYSTARRHRTVANPTRSHRMLQEKRWLGGTTDSIEPVLADIAAEHRRWMGLMERLDPAEAASRTAGAWSAIETLTHVASWQENALAIALEQSKTEARTLDPNQGAARTLGIDVDRFNGESLASHSKWSKDEAVRWSEEMTSALLKALAALPAERLFGGRARHGARMWYWRPAVVHSREHRRELEGRARSDPRGGWSER